MFTMKLAVLALVAAVAVATVADISFEDLEKQEGQKVSERARCKVAHWRALPTARSTARPAAAAAANAYTPPAVRGILR